LVKNIKKRKNFCKRSRKRQLWKTTGVDDVKEAHTPKEKKEQIE